MRRSRVLAGWASILALISVSTWLVAAERSGELPPGNYAAIPHRKWPLTPARADAIRHDALERAAIRLPAPTGGVAIGRYVGRVPRSGPAGQPPVRPLACRFLNEALTGTSAKFNCVLEGGEIIKVKYNRNLEIHAEAAASELLSTLGFPADAVTTVPRLRCYGCPRYPFFTTQLLWLASSTELLSPHGYEHSYTDFEWVSVESKFPAPAIEAGPHKGWAWWELERSQAPRADLDALRLLAVFLAHWDNKAENQRLVCLDALPPSPDQPCAQPLLMIQDLGSTFGPAKMNLAQWRDLPVWADPRRCTVTMRQLPYRGATFPDAQISEEGRAQLATQLAALDDSDIRGLFARARFAEFHSATDDERDLRAWTAAFRERVDQIVMAGPC